jgi:hypothetical protein
MGRGCGCCSIGLTEVEVGHSKGDVETSERARSRLVSVFPSFSVHLY